MASKTFLVMTAVIGCIMLLWASMLIAMRTITLKKHPREHKEWILHGGKLDADQTVNRMKEMMQALTPGNVYKVSQLEDLYSEIDFTLRGLIGPGPQQCIRVLDNDETAACDVILYNLYVVYKLRAEWDATGIQQILNTVGTNQPYHILLLATSPAHEILLVPNEVSALRQICYETLKSAVIKDLNTFDVISSASGHPNYKQACWDFLNELVADEEVPDETAARVARMMIMTVAQNRANTQPMTDSEAGEILTTLARGRYGPIHRDRAFQSYLALFAQTA